MSTDPLSQYKESVKERLDNADVLISKLINENTLLTTKIDSKDQTIDQLRKQILELQTTNKSLQDSLDKSEENIEVVKDLFEHLCGIRVHTLYEDDSGLWFDASQGRKTTTTTKNNKNNSNNNSSNEEQESVMDYKLGFVKGDNAETEVIYVPLLKQRSTEELKNLQERLPSYMFDTLSFPLKSLNQFYNKMSKCLGKVPGISSREKARSSKTRTESPNGKDGGVESQHHNDSHSHGHNHGRGHGHSNNRVTATTPPPIT